MLSVVADIWSVEITDATCLFLVQAIETIILTFGINKTDHIYYKICRKERYHTERGILYLHKIYHMSKTKIAIVGCGNMGMIYARAFLKYDVVDRESLLLAEKNEQRAQELNALNIGRVTVASDPRIADSDIIIIAVKPQDFPALSAELKKNVCSHNLIISIMAGITISTLQQALNTDKIVRAMPNSPAEVGMGMTGFTCPPSLNMDLLRKAENLLSTTGRCIFFEHEEMIDAVTALSGSGPAYFFYIVKYMIEAGKRMGIEESMAAIMVKQTMHGAFHLINNAEKSLDDLIVAVASRGGTTEAALLMFEKKQVGENIVEGILAAGRRARELSM